MPNPLQRRAGLAILVCSALAGTLLPAAAALAGSIEGSGRAGTETRAPGSFKAIRSSASIDMVVSQGETAQLVVRGDDNLLAHLETVVESGTLHVRWKPGTSLRTHVRTVVEVTTPTLDAYASSGSGDLKLGPFKTPALELSLTGSGDAALASLSAEHLRIRVTGSGDVKGAGRAARVDIGISGSGDVGLAELEADDVTVRIAGSGDAAVMAGKTLKVSIAGSGDVTYAGAPALSSSVAGSGRVRKR